jgi:type IV secretory pathway VirB2 component (pilin)
MKSNVRVPEGVQDAGRGANRAARDAASSHWMPVLARLGYAAKGIVYLIIGWLAVQLVIGAGGKTTDQRGALQTIYEQPFGKFLLALVVIGLLGFAIWCFLQAWFDTEGKGSDIKGIIGRLGYAITGVSYAILAFGAFQLLTRTGTGSATKSTTSSTQDVTAQLLQHSWGVTVVVILGLIVIGVACYMFAKAISARFQRRLALTGLSAQLRRGVIFLGRFGYAALGVVFSIVGIFLIVAAVQHNPHEAKGLDAALRTLIQQPFGPVLLGIVALGLIAYGVYSFVEARYRRVGVS